MKIKKLILFLLLLFILIIISLAIEKFNGLTINENVNYPMEKVFVTKIIDGDTIVVNGEIGNDIHIRLLGINTLEKGMALSNDATNYLKNEILDKEIEIQRDKIDVDKYGRNLRYVFYNGKIINVEILQQGLATSFMTDELVYETKLKNAERIAKENGEGIWKKSDEVCSNCLKLDQLNNKEEYFIIKNECNFDCDLKGWYVKDDANHFFYLENMKSLEMKQYISETNVWNSDKDRFFLRDKNGLLVIFYEY